MGKMRFKCFITILMVAAITFSSTGRVFAETENDANIGERQIIVFKDSLISNVKKDDILKHSGAKKLKDLPLINAMVVNIDPGKVRALGKYKEVLRVESDAAVHIQAPKVQKQPPGSEPVTSERLPWGVGRINAEKVWDKDRDLILDRGANAGGGVKVAVLDTGIDLDHPDLRANVIGGYNVINPRKSADDDNGHGTHVAGVIAGVDNDTGVVGTAPEALLYAVKVLDSRGSGYISDVIAGLEWCVNSRMHVVNMSFGASVDIASFHDAIKAAYDSGIVLVAAAGNGGPYNDAVSYPAKYDEVIAVSATDNKDAVAGFSRRGPEIDLAAPGVDIYSTYKNGGYKILSGTSMAASHVTGVVALIINSGITGSDDIRAKLLNTADDFGQVGWDCLYGHGLVDAEEAAAGVQDLQ